MKMGDRPKRMELDTADVVALHRVFIWMGKDGVLRGWSNPSEKEAIARIMAAIPEPSYVPNEEAVEALREAWRSRAGGYEDLLVALHEAGWDLVNRGVG